MRFVHSFDRPIRAAPRVERTSSPITGIRSRFLVDAIGPVVSAVLLGIRSVGELVELRQESLGDELGDDFGIVCFPTVRGTGADQEPSPRFAQTDHVDERFRRHMAMEEGETWE